MSKYKYISKTWKNGRWNYLYKRASASIRWGKNKQKTDYQVKTPAKTGSSYSVGGGKTQWTSSIYTQLSNQESKARDRADASRRKANAKWAKAKSGWSKHWAWRASKKAKQAEDKYLKDLKSKADNARESYNKYQNRVNKQKKRKWYDVPGKVYDRWNRAMAQDRRWAANGYAIKYRKEARRMRNTKR